ncbi:MAG: LacI family DNA-binding transcriptional regulator [Acutalibacteraceae bacterium]
MSKVTIYDVAKAAHCSTATVSLVLNNSDRIKPETHEHVMRVVEKLGYTPNYIAQSLSMKSTNTLGLIVPNIDNPLFSKMITGVEEYATINGYDLILGITNSDSEKERFYLDMLQRKRVDGLMLFPTYIDSIIEKIHNSTKSKTPIVLCGSSGKGAANISFVKCDNRIGSYLAINHLLDIGCSKVGCVFPVYDKKQYSSRLSGYQDALYYRGIEYSPSLIKVCSPDDDSIYNATLELLKEQKPDGLFCLYDYAAISVMKAVLSQGLRIPDDVALIGYDNISISKFLPISLSTIDTLASEVGRHAAEILITKINEPETPVRQITLKPNLIVRESTQKISIED